jgi:hypothetical protein
MSPILKYAVTVFCGKSHAAHIESKYFILARAIWIFLFYVIGVEYYQRTENWNLVECLYFITVSIATIGYGQLHPTSDPSRLFTAFYNIVGLFTVLTFVDIAAEFCINLPLEKILMHISSDERRQRWKTFVNFSALCLLMLVGVWFYAVNENWSSSESFYWTIQTMTTIGYGDLLIKHDSTRIFSLFFIVICLVFYAAILQNLASVERSASSLRLSQSEGISEQSSTEMVALAGSKDSSANMRISSDRFIVDVLLRQTPELHSRIVTLRAVSTVL